MTQKTINVPDIGNFTNVDVIAVLVKPGDTVKIESPLITIESEKAAMDLPSPATGKITEILVKIGDQVSKGSPIVELNIAESSSSPTVTMSKKQVTMMAPKLEAVSAAEHGASVPRDSDTIDLLVLGSGPGGYTAAFRAADLGLRTVLVEEHRKLGGVCLNVGCIPSKALLHAARVIEEARDMEVAGLKFGEPAIELDRLRAWKDKVISQLTGGLTSLTDKRKIQVIRGTGEFISSNEILITSDASQTKLKFHQAIIATGSNSVPLPDLPKDKRIIDSSGALALKEIPERLLIIGGGIIGLEMATVYHSLGSRVTVVEMMDQLMSGVDIDLLKPLEQRLKKRCEDIYLGTRVSRVTVGRKSLEVHFDGSLAPSSADFDSVLVAVGRKPNSHFFGAQAAGVTVDKHGFIPVNREQRTSATHIFAIGDVVGPPMLAHKAAHEGKVAAEVAAGLKSIFDSRVIPSVAYTDPEVAWVGITENEARAQNIAYEKGIFPWAASGRALSLGRSEGMTKLLFDPNTRRLLGAGIVGPNAGDLVAEACLAIEMNCEAEDIGLTVHPHPTLSETIAFAAETFAGTVTDLYSPQKK